MKRDTNIELAFMSDTGLATNNLPVVNSRLTWLGKEHDAESGLGDHGVRKYDNQTGRFTAPDPLYEKYINWTPYQYALNNPISFVDVDGKKIDWTAYTRPDKIEEGQKGLQQTLEYLDNGGTKSQALAKRIRELEQDEQYTLFIGITEYGYGENANYSKGENTPYVEWMPDAAMVEPDGDKFTPIIGFIEELIHEFHACDDPKEVKRYLRVYVPGYDNLEEFRTKMEVNSILDEHGDESRFNGHKGTHYQCGSPDEK